MLSKGVAQAIHEPSDGNEDETIIVTTVMPVNSDFADHRPRAAKESRHSNSTAEVKTNESGISIDNSAMDKGIISSTKAKDTTLSDPMYMDDIEIKVDAPKHPPIKTNSKEEVHHPYEYVAVSSLPDTQQQTDAEILGANVPSIDEMYARVNKIRGDKTFDFNTGKHSTDVEYEEMEYVAEEECITRF